VKVSDVNELAARQFRAKSHSLSLMTPYSLVNGGGLESIVEGDTEKSGNERNENGIGTQS
jgi:hypothetical protein